MQQTGVAGDAKNVGVVAEVRQIRRLVEAAPQVQAQGHLPDLAAGEPRVRLAASMPSLREGGERGGGHPGRVECDQEEEGEKAGGGGHRRQEFRKRARERERGGNKMGRF